jgi:hypothetical protein
MNKAAGKRPARKGRHKQGRWEAASPKGQTRNIKKPTGCNEDRCFA